MNKHDMFMLINGKIRVSIIANNPEKILNMIWKREIEVRDVNRDNLYTICLTINSSDFKALEEICKQNQSNLSIIELGRLFKFLHNFKVHITLAVGVSVSLGIIMFLSMFIWKIDIVGDHHVSPYEIRQVVNELGVHKGMLKFKIDTDVLEDEIVSRNKNLLWSKARVQGSTLKIEVIESFKPPVIEVDTSLGNIVAEKDGEIVRVYTQSGTAQVQAGMIVKKGDILIAGYQGKEGSVYETPPIGDVIAKTFLEFEEVVELEGTKNVNTKNKVEEYYIQIFGKKLYLKKYRDEYKDYDKVSDDGKFIKKNIYYEVCRSPYKLNPDNVKKDLVDYYTKYVKQNLKQTDSIVGVVVKDEIEGNKLKIRISFAIEEKIGVKVPKTDGQEPIIPDTFQSQGNA